MTVTLEQELAQLIEHEDYRVIIVHTGSHYINLKIVYLPKLRIRGEGAWSYIANGVIAEQHFMQRNPRRRWRAVRKWAVAEIAGHRELVGTMVQA